MRLLNRLTLPALLAVAVLTSCAEPQTKCYNQGINIIPIPLSMTESPEGEFALKSRTKISASSPESETIAQFFAKKINLATGYNIELTQGSAPIELSIDPSLGLKKEGYTLSVTPEKVTIVGRDSAGLFYGMQSFMQLLPAEINSQSVVKGVKWSAPAVEISDEPQFSYRGIMIDICRHFMPMEDLKRQIDLLAMFKINTLHWHLTEDQAWRIEIKKYPKLTEVGATRIEGEGFEYSGFYTQEQVKEVVAYASERQVTIIPEFELPGHELAAIAAYPELSCRGEQVTPRIVWGVEDIVMCPAKEGTFRFIEDVIDEMTQLFPGEYFHVGGDECPKVSWKECPNCQALIRRERLQAKDGHTAEERLQSYIIHKAEQMLLARGKKMIGWDEILEGGVSESATIMSWRGEKGGITAAMADRDVVMTPNSYLYLDYYQGDSAVEPVGIGGYVPLEKTYSYNPIPQLLAENGKSGRIKGVQANLWTEYMYTVDIAEYNLYPRVLALAEVGWSAVERKDFEDFSRRMGNAYVRLDGAGVNYHIPLPEQPVVSANVVAFTDSATLEFKTTRPIKMVYTTDGSEPTPSSTKYSEPLSFTESTTLKIRTVLPSGVMSTIREIAVEKQSYAPATEVEGAKSGLKMVTIPGYYLNTEALAASTEEPTLSFIGKMEDIVQKSPRGKKPLPNSEQTSRIVEGYIEIPQDGVYYFRTNNNEFWIDGELLLSNDNKVKRWSQDVKSIALEAGLHPIKMIWLGHIMGGWPSNWEDGALLMREASEDKMRAVSADKLFYTL